MKHLATSLAMALFASAALASGSGGGGGMGSTPQMQPRDPHEQAVGYYNSGERQLEKATKANADLKANTDASKADGLKSRRDKSLENAAADFNRAIKADPNLYQAYSELGFCLRKLGHYDEALATYDKGLAIEPRWAPAIEYRGEALLGLGRVEDAKASYQALFDGDRVRADILFDAMKAYSADHKDDAALAKWVDERSAIHAQTAASTQAARADIRSW